MDKILNNKIFIAIAIALIVLLVFVQNGATPLWDEDESAYAGFAKTMLETGNWLIPDFLWSDIHRKTPLHFWNIAISYNFFGISEFATRLSSSLSVLLTLFLLFFWGKNIFGKNESLLAALILGSSFLVPTLGKIAVTDATLLLFQTAAVLAMGNFLFQPSAKWRWIFWIAIALGVLTKGPPILILTFGMGFFLYFFHENGKNLLGLRPWFGLPLALLPLGVWGWLAWQQDGGELVSMLWDWYVLSRIGLGSSDVSTWTGPPGYYLAVLLAAFFPWLIFFPSALWDLFKNYKIKTGVIPFLMAWILFGWIIYEILPSKLPAYTLAAHPAMAILLAKQILKLNELKVDYKNIYKLSAVLFLFLSFGLAVAVIFYCGTYFEKIGFQSAVPVATVLWVGSFAGVIGIFGKRVDWSFIALFFMGILFNLLSWVFVIPLTYDSFSTTKKVAAKCAEIAPDKNREVIFYLETKNLLPSLPFYISYNFKNYNSIGKLEKVLPKINSNQPLLLITDDGKIEKLKKAFEEKGETLPAHEVVEGWSLDRLQDKKMYIFKIN